MMERNNLIAEYLQEKLKNIKVGILVKGIENIEPEKIIKKLIVMTGTRSKLYVAAVGYEGVIARQESDYNITDSIEEAVKWRSMPELAKSIIVFIKSDVAKLHSLAEFEVMSIRDISRFLIKKQLEKNNNTPTHDFWEAMDATSDYYTFDSLSEFIIAVEKSNESAVAIPQNMWRLNLLQDNYILGTKSKPEDRLSKNRNLIFAIGQLSEDSRKKLSRSLARIKSSDKEKLQKAYQSLQNFYKYGNRETLKSLDYDVVQELFFASKKGNKNGLTGTKPGDNVPVDASPIRPKELGTLISDAVVNGNEDDLGEIRELLEGFKNHYASGDGQRDGVTPPRFRDRDIVLESQQTNLRKLVGKFCNIFVWGGIMETEESVLKDAIAADIVNESPFNPTDNTSIISSTGGVDGPQALFKFITEFDKQFDEKEIDEAERFAPIIKNLIENREKLIERIDLIMYQPVLLFGADEECRKVLIEYIHNWEELYHAFSVNEVIMRELSASGTSFLARAILLLDVLYVKTPKEWKSILLPLHPLFLWRYYEIFRMLPSKKETLSDEDKEVLTKVLSQLPQVLNFIIANDVVTQSEDRVLPCSGNIEMLPTFENKTNRYLGRDGTESIKEMLTRWIGFAPYTQNEVRICSVDAPDLIENLHQIKSFMDESSCKRVVYDVYLTRQQNGNTELSKLEYSGDDHEIGEYIKTDRISISIKNVSSADEVKKILDTRPVHLAFYFDQSSYTIEFGPNSRNLYITPLVITYDYKFDEVEHRGSIFPSPEMDSGLIGDYYKLMRSADVISKNMSPRTTYNGNADMTAVVSTIEDAQVQWLIVADRDTNNYQPGHAIPIGEKQYDKRMVNVWASDNSRIIDQYITLLRKYNLYPESKTLIGILKQFGHIASSGLISIPKYGADTNAIANKRKGLLGTLFAASWYMNKYSDDALVASLDDDRARIWLQDSKLGNERADLVGLHYDEQNNILHIQPIEVKTRDDSPDATIVKDEGDSKRFIIKGHAAEQIGLVVEILRDIFTYGEDTTDMFTSARREVLKYQIVSECFRNVHNADWQKKWTGILKKAFGNGKSENISVNISGILLHIKLNEASGSEHFSCQNPEFGDCNIDYWKLTSREIQEMLVACETNVPTGEKQAAKNKEMPGKSDDTVSDPLVGQDQAEEAHKEDSLDKEQKSEKSEDKAQGTGDLKTDDTDTPEEKVVVKEDNSGISKEEIQRLANDFAIGCNDYHINLQECDPAKAVVGPSVIRLKFKLAHGQNLQALNSRLEDIGRDMKRTGIIIQPVLNSNELLLDIPRLKREQVLFKDVIPLLPKVESPEQLYFPLGRTPNGDDLIEDLGQMPHMLVGGSTGSGKSVFLFTMLASLLMSHPRKEDLQLILSSSKLEDFNDFRGLPHLTFSSGEIISDASVATDIIKEVIYAESTRRGDMLANARVANIIDYNKVAKEKMPPIVVVIDEFADLADQLDTKKEVNAFYKPVQRIAQTGRSRGIHLVVCTQRPEAKLVPPSTKAQLNGRVALRVNDGMSSRMIIESPDAQYLQKHGDMIYKNADKIERAQGYFIEMLELREILSNIIKA